MAEQQQQPQQQQNEDQTRVRNNAAVKDAMDFLEPDELAEIKEAFQIFEVDGEGYIPTDKLKKALHAMGENPNDTDILNYIREFDLERANKIEFPEFVVILVRRIKTTAVDELRQAFKRFDTDGNGYISPAELRIVMTNFGERLTDEEVDEIIFESDWNSDGQIDFEEFVAMMLTNHERLNRVKEETN